MDVREDEKIWLQSSPSFGKYTIDTPKYRQRKLTMLKTSEINENHLDESHTSLQLTKSVETKRYFDEGPETTKRYTELAPLVTKTSMKEASEIRMSQ